MDNKFFNTLIVMFIFSGFCIAKDDMMLDCDNLSCALKEYGNPSLKYKNEFKDSCYVYKVTNGYSRICSNGSKGFSSYLKIPDTTELIVKNLEFSIFSMFGDSFQKGFRSGLPISNNVQIYVIKSFEKEKLISFHFNDSMGIIEEPKDRSFWSEMNEALPGGGGKVKTENFESKQEIIKKEINVKALNSILVNDKIDILGSIQKKRAGMMDGTTIVILSNRDGKSYYSEFNLIPWYNEKYDRFSKEIQKILNAN